MEWQGQASREAIEGAFAWWRDAGVDSCFSDTVHCWLEQGDTEAEESVEQPIAPAKEPPRRSAIERALDTPDAAQIGGDAAAWPQDLGAFREFWLTEPTLDESGTTGRVLARGAADARLMVLVAQPEADDADRLLSGQEGRFLSAILSAMGLAEGETYIASALPRHVRLPDWNDLATRGLGSLTRHHIALAKPERLLVFGRGLTPLLGTDDTPPEKITMGDRSIPLMIAPRLDRLARMPGTRKQFWTTWLDWSAHA